MRRLRKEKIKEGNNSRYSVAGLFFTLMLLLFFALGATEPANIIYKGPKGINGLFPDRKTGGNLKKMDQKSIQGYVYNPLGKTDPFKSFIDVQESVEDKRKRKTKTYLETLDLSHLDLTAIITGPQGNWAMLRDAKGFGHVIREGTAVGMNEGIVNQIKDHEIILRENYTDFKGRVKTKYIKRKLHTE